MSQLARGAKRERENKDKTRTVSQSRRCRYQHTHSYTRTSTLSHQSLQQNNFTAVKSHTPNMVFPSAPSIPLSTLAAPTQSPKSARPLPADLLPVPRQSQPRHFARWAFVLCQIAPTVHALRTLHFPRQSTFDACHKAIMSGANRVAGDSEYHSSRSDSKECQ